MFRPQYIFDKIWDIPFEFLKDNKINAVFLDVDNTLTTHDNPAPGDGVEKWLEDAKNAGLKLLILSNNTVERVTPFAKMLGLDFEAHGKKPLRSGYLRAIKKLGISPKEALAIGDQIFTDVLGARLCGIHCIFTDPIEPEHTKFFKFKRWAERPILASFVRSRRK